MIIREKIIENKKYLNNLLFRKKESQRIIRGKNMEKYFQ